MSKKIIIDFEKISDPFSGLGQVCLNLGHYFIQSKQTPFLWLKKESFDFFENYPNKIALTKWAKKIPFMRPRCDLFHAIHQDSPYLPRNTRAKYVLTVHDLNGLYEIKDKKKKLRYYKAIQKRILRSDAITYISAFTKTEVEKNFIIPKNTIQRIIYNGIALKTLDLKKVSELKLPTTRPYLFSIGTVVPKKNFHTLIEMMPHLPDFDLVIAGTLFHDYAKNMQKRIAELGLNDRIHLIGTIDEEMKYKLYQNAHGFLFPSLLEGFGLPVVEAMSFGLPVFISNLTSLPEIGGPHAFYFENFEAFKMAEIVKSGLTSFDEKKKENSVLWAKQFSFLKASAEYLKLYDDLLN